MDRSLLRGLSAALAGLLLAAGAARAESAAPAPVPCPSALPEGTRCLGGRDEAGAFYRIAIPKDWNGHLVMHTHGGPTLGPPRAERVEEDLQRWAVVVRAGYAWAGSTFHQGGVAVRAAAEDTERLRQLYVHHFGRPKRTLLHGQSWGAGVAAITAEMYGNASGPEKPYDGVLLTSGVLGGGSLSYDFRLDLRVVYQALCHNHPKPDEADYPLWMGLPADSRLTASQLAQRADECLGVSHPEAQRSAEQQRRLRTIVDVIRIPERSVLGHLNWATFHFQDIVQKRTAGGNPFGNIGVHYRGSPDDVALNAQVARYRADPAAVARFAADTDPTGRIGLPVLTVHGINDPVAFVELESVFRQTMERGGSAERLVQTFTDDNEHSYLSDPAYPTLLAALERWIDSGQRPTPQDIARQCPAMQARFGPGCRFLPDYQPAALDSRVPRRDKR